MNTIYKYISNAISGKILKHQKAIKKHQNKKEYLSFFIDGQLPLSTALF